jgi:hypothetical protein
MMIMMNDIERKLDLIWTGMGNPYWLRQRGLRYSKSPVELHFKKNLWTNTSNQFTFT